MSDKRTFRVIDTGRRGGRANIAFDKALIEAHKAGRVPDTIRFLHFGKTALVGMHQYVGQEVRVEHCRDNGIEIVRRITGGGAIYIDEGQLGWELVFHRGTLGITDLAQLAKRICEAAALGLNSLGVPARFRPRNDIEVDGRKISGTGGFFDGDTLFYQGTLLIDFDPKDMITALKVPEEKLAKHDLDDARDRVTTMRRVLGDRLPDLPAIREGMLWGFAEALGIAPVWGEVSSYEEETAQTWLEEEIGTDEFVYMLDRPGSGADIVSAARTGAGGTVKAHLRLEGERRDRIREALVTGDFFVTPPRIVRDLEASLRGVSVGEAGAAVDAFFRTADLGLLTIAPADFRAVIEDALAGAKVG